MNLLVVLLLILVLGIISNTNILENFGGYQMYQQFIPFYPINTYKYPPTTAWWNNFGIPISNGSTDLPWNNTQLGVTSNMSYDLRGDPTVIPRVQVSPNGAAFEHLGAALLSPNGAAFEHLGAALLSPWNNPEVYPIYNTGLGVLY